MSNQSSFIVTFFKGQRVIANPSVVGTSAKQAESIALEGFDYGYNNMNRFVPPSKDKYTHIGVKQL